MQNPKRTPWLQERGGELVTGCAWKQRRETSEKEGSVRARARLKQSAGQRGDGTSDNREGKAAKVKMDQPRRKHAKL